LLLGVGLDCVAHEAIVRCELVLEPERFLLLEGLAGRIGSTRQMAVANVLPGSDALRELERSRADELHA
jgi:hypothetical protein